VSKELLKIIVTQEKGKPPRTNVWLNGNKIRATNVLFDHDLDNWPHIELGAYLNEKEYDDDDES